METVFIQNLHFECINGLDLWGRSRKQPLDISISIKCFQSLDNNSDDLHNRLCYSSVAKAVGNLVNGSSFSTTHELALHIIQLIIHEFSPFSVKIKISKPGALGVGEAFGVEMERENGSNFMLSDLMHSNAEDRIFLERIYIPAILGMNDHEQTARQMLILDVDVFFPSFIEMKSEIIDPVEVSSILIDLIESSRFKTLEILIHSCISALEKRFCSVSFQIKAQKPKAISMAESAGVIGRSKPRIRSAFLGVGTNSGDRLSNIYKAMSLLKERDISILDVSFLYETPPAYEIHQSKFLNCAFKVETKLDPTSLLDVIKQIEKDVGRVETHLNGPRMIDLDILFYADAIINFPHLVIPHPRIAERLFVLLPLNDICPSFVHPKEKLSISQLLSSALQSTPSIPMGDGEVTKVFPLRNQFLKIEKETWIMGILNVTPDSFSDGNLYYDQRSALNHASDMINEGASIIDVGGMSTRPNAEEIEESEELKRVVPVIEALRKNHPNIVISIDTFRSEVAFRAIQAGADLINDISAGRRDPKILDVAKKMNVPICLMHSKGDSKTMMNMTDYSGRNILSSISLELSLYVNKALQKGIPRWNILVDPGIGFAKNTEQCCGLLNGLINERREFLNFPLLIGVSKKSFIGKILDLPNPQDRGNGTAAAVTASVAANAAIIRVHDVKASVEIAKVARAIWH